MYYSGVIHAASISNRGCSTEKTYSIDFLFYTFVYQIDYKH